MTNIKILDKNVGSDILRQIGDEEGIYYVTYLKGKVVSQKISFDHFKLFMANYELTPKNIALREVQALIMDEKFIEDGQSIYIIYVCKLFNAFLRCDNANELRFIDSATLREIKKSVGV